MSRLTGVIIFSVLYLFSSVVASAEPDESGIGGTGVSKPRLNDTIFSRPDIPEIADTPEVPELSVPEIDDALDGIQSIDSGLSRDDVPAPADVTD